MRGLSTGQVILLVALGAGLILTGVWGVSVWSASAGVEMGTAGSLSALEPFSRSSSGAGSWH